MAARNNGEDRRPSADALLAAANRERRGRLKVFLGAAPGVGKTYAMLESARRRQADGVDVAVGLIETHGRQETEALLDGLEVLPRRRIDYRGRDLMEFDLDGALARRPALMLVDELAHSNVAGSRHPKRFQDVDELLAAGIDVDTTLNIQHLESLNDVIMRITRIRVRETLPDEVLARADEIELIDITPEDLIRRLNDGKVYVPENAQRAVNHFFQPGNLTALRELALRRAAERVDDQMVDYMRRHAIEGPWQAGERVLVCVAADALAQTLVRTGRRLSDLMRAPFIAVHVESPDQDDLDGPRQALIDEAMQLAGRLGGEIVTLQDSDLPGVLLRYARRNNITQIVIGADRRRWWDRLRRRSLVQALMRRSEGCALHVVCEDPAAEKSSEPALVPPWWRRIGVGAIAAPVLSVALAVGIADAITHYVPLPNVSMVFLMAVVFCALTRGMASSILAAFLSFLAYNFFFIEPIYTLSITDGHDLFALLMFLVVAVAMGGSAGRTRDRALAARERFRATQLLFGFTEKLGGAAKLGDVLWVVVNHVATHLGGRTVLLMPVDGELAISAAFPPDDELETSEWAAARWCFAQGEPTGVGTVTLPTVPWRFQPIQAPRGAIGVLGLLPSSDRRAMTADERRLLDALVDQAAVAIERAQLAGEIAEAQLMAETERLRTALLSSISHDLRTPLSSILGSATSLSSYGASMSETARSDLLSAIQEEAERLNRYVANLLDMTRLESGALDLRRDWVDVAELCDGAVERIAKLAGGRRIVRRIADGLPALRLDFVLMEQALFNILDNAIKYGPPDAPIILEAERRDADVVVSVTDEGPGVPSEDLERIFDKFHRVQQPHVRASGAGLGLSICRGFVAAMGGRVSVVSPVRDGRGATFKIALPLSLADAAS